MKKRQKMRPDVVLIDIELEGEINGIEAAKRICNSLDIPTIYLADYRIEVFSKKEDLLKRAEITNPFEYIPQPYGKRKLYLSIESTVYQHRMEENKQHLTKILNGISDAAIATDNKGSITFMNPVCRTLDRLGNGRSIWEKRNGYSQYLCWKRRTAYKKYVFDRSTPEKDLLPPRNYLLLLR